MNELSSRNDLALFLDIPLKQLTYILYKADKEKLYNKFEIPKKSGGVRVIYAPEYPLKIIQKRLADKLTKYYEEVITINSISSKIPHGFIPDRSIITNAEIHRNKKFVLNTDLKDFFPSLHFGRVKGYFEKNKYFKLTPKISTMIAQLTCYDGSLPQGAPTSPIISNLICSILDYKILEIAKKYKFNFTRYVDDLTFSTNNNKSSKNIDSFLDEIRYIVEKTGFKLNDTKTRLQFKDSRQEVTGLTVNNKLNTKKEFRKNTRAMANRLYTTGSFYIDNNEGTLEQLEGRFSFINQLDWYNNKNEKNNKEKLNHFYLNSREKEYQQFLYYKYFIGNEKPLIITEGKTDPKYIKAALNKLYNKYPKLVTLNSFNQYTYRIQFLDRFTKGYIDQSNKLSYFFNLKEDGADTMKNIFNLYKGKHGFNNYWEKFTIKYNNIPMNPVIIIFDNEDVKGKPLKTFLDYLNNNGVKTNNEFRESLQRKSYVRIIGNLYILVPPLVEGKSVAEIEDLFDQKTLGHKINNKKFVREKGNPKLHYGKQVFSEYILNNYYQINFDNFVPFLDSLENVLSDYQIQIEKDLF